MNGNNPFYFIHTVTSYPVPAIKRIIKAMKFESILNAKSKNPDEVVTPIPGIGVITYNDTTGKATIELEPSYKEFFHSQVADDPSKIRKTFINFIKEPL